MLVEESDREILLLSNDDKAVSIREDLLSKSSHAGAVGSTIFTLKSGAKIIKVVPIDEVIAEKIPAKVKKSALPSTGVAFDSSSL